MGTELNWITLNLSQKGNYSAAVKREKKKKKKQYIYLSTSDFRLHLCSEFHSCLNSSSSVHLEVDFCFIISWLWEGKSAGPVVMISHHNRWMRKSTRNPVRSSGSKPARDLDSEGTRKLHSNCKVANFVVHNVLYSPTLLWLSSLYCIYLLVMHTLHCTVLPLHHVFLNPKITTKKKRKQNPFRGNCIWSSSYFSPVMKEPKDSGNQVS